MTVGVIGAGIMGSGIAQAFAANEDYQVILCDINLELARIGKSEIEKNLLKLVTKQKLEQADANALLSRISAGIAEDVSDCALIVEAVGENMVIKRQLFQRLQGICGKDAIFTSNTSSLSVTELSAGLDRPVVGMHFFNPAPVMKLVEIVVGMATPPELADTVKAIAEDIGKTPIMVRDSAGFAVNRILIPMINEAVGVLAEGVASADDIDAAMKLGANHPIGPLALGDLVGLDVCLAIMEVLFSEFGDSKYRPHPLLKKMVRAGMLGRKSGQGFFSYPS